MSAVYLFGVLSADGIHVTFSQDLGRLVCCYECM